MDRPRYLEVRQPGLAMLDDAGREFLAGRCPRCRDDEGHWNHVQHGVAAGNHGHLSNAAGLHAGLFHLSGGDVFPPYLEGIPVPVAEIELSLGAQANQIAGLEPAVFGEGLGVGLGLVVILEEQLDAAHAAYPQLTHFAGLTEAAAVGLDNGELIAWRGLTHAARRPLPHIVRAGSRSE